VRDDQTERVFSAAGIDIDFTTDSQNTDFHVEYTDLSALHALGYAGAAPDLVQLDGPAIFAAGQSAGASTNQVITATGTILAHELGHKFLGGGHSSTGIMRTGLDVGTTVFRGIDMSGQLYFTPEQAAIIRRKCRKMHQQHPLPK
jgi:hypothetical protein